MARKIGLPVSVLVGLVVDDVSKSSGFSRGLGGGFHKYRRRVRRMVGGKLRWVYYYDDEKQVGAGKKHDPHGDHKHISELPKDHAAIARPRKALKDLNEEYVGGELHWGDQAPDLALTPAYRERWEAILSEYGDVMDLPVDPGGETLTRIPMMRALEIAFQKLPDSIREMCVGCVSDIDVVADRKDDPNKHNPKGSWAAYCQYRGGRGGKSRMVFSAAHSETAWGDPTHYMGALAPMEIVWHELAHSIQVSMGFQSPGNRPPGDDNWSSLTWQDWLDHMAKIKKSKELPITSYATKNEKERFAESFAATLSTPRYMASIAPETYEFFRKLIGEEYVRPIRTDQAMIDDLEKERLKAINSGNLQEAHRIAKLQDHYVGVLDMPEWDRRLQWWAPDETKVQQHVREHLSVNDVSYEHTYRVEPKDPTKTGKQGRADRFYEMSVGGRTVYMRIGPASPDKSFSGWEPGKAKKSRLQASEVKEIYNENGEPLDFHTAWWWLNQDRLPDDNDLVRDFQGFDTGKGGSASRGAGGSNKAYNAVTSRWIQKVLRQVDQWSGARKSERPNEISAIDFRMRSGTFAYDRWDAAGHVELDALRRETNQKKRDRLLAAFMKKQPYVRIEAVMVRDAQGRFTRDSHRTPVLSVKKRGEQPTPILNTVRYVNDNPDGTSTVIGCTRDDSGDVNRAGRYYIDSPIWRNLLTPRGEHIESAEHLAELCRRAAMDRRRAWVSVQTDAKGGDTGHYYHLQVEFDGKGQPRILGSEWARILGKKEPRLDDILATGKTARGEEAGRPVIKAESIKLRPRKKSTIIRNPQVGQRVLLDVAGPEMGRVNDATVIARLIHIIPKKNAGEVPPPPKWSSHHVKDNVVPNSYLFNEALDSYFRLDDDWNEDGSVPTYELPELTDDEKALKESGQLPDHYMGWPDQREWFESNMRPVLDFYDAHKDEMTKEAWPVRYVFAGEIGGGGGGKRFIRSGKKAAVDSIRPTFESRAPVPLKDNLLVYMHDKVDPRTGQIMESEPRVLLPSNGRIPIHQVEAIRGITAVYRTEPDPDRPGKNMKVLDHMRANLDGFANMRDIFGAVSLTSSAEKALAGQVDALREAAQKAKDDSHVMELDQITPANLQAMGAGVNAVLPGGVPFTLAHHQAELVQKCLDNDGRCLAAHYMGTGKTVSAIVAAKTMMALRDPEDPSKPHPNAPKKVCVVAPLNTIEQWREAASTFDEGATVVGAGKNHIPVDTYVEMVRKGLDSSDLVVVGPEYWTANQAKLKEAGFDGIIVDEAHQGIANEKAKRNRAMSAWNSDMKMMMLLTGTPMTTTPADFLEYIKLLSQGQQFAGMTANQFADEYLEESVVVGAAGMVGRKGPKIQIKADKLQEFAAILNQYTHVAMPKDVRGKTLPAVRIEESQHAHMTGIQAQLYALHMAALSPSDAARLSSNAQALSSDETAGLSQDGKRSVLAAKAIANCPAYKPASSDPFVMVEVEKPDAKGEMQTAKSPWVTFDPDYLTNRKLRKKQAGRWPPIEQIGTHAAMLYSMHFGEMFGVSDYSQLAGTSITKAQLKAMRDDGWPRKEKNPEAGPAGIRCRGYDIPGPPHPDAEKAVEFQRIFSGIVGDEEMIPAMGGGKEVSVIVGRDQALERAAAQFGVSLEEGNRLLGIRPDTTKHHKYIDASLTGWGIRGVRVSEGDRWVSDKRGSLHLLYRPEDWDESTGKPKEGGGFETANDGDVVNVAKAAGVKAPAYDEDGNKLNAAGKREWLDNLVFRYDATLGEDSKGRVAVTRMDTGDIHWVKKSAITTKARSLMDPGMRAERDKADMAMVMGNAKAEELRNYILNFHEDTGPGPNGPRQMVLFANSILDGCRTMEATLRTMGFKDVNEAIEGSPHYDPEDSGPAANGKYFVTYIGGTYTGDRMLNTMIFQKVKDKLGRDTDESLFVNRCNVGKRWSAYPGDSDDHGIKMSQFSPEQRRIVKRQFGIEAPEAYFVDEKGVQRYFYGNGKSAAILREIVLVGNPVKMAEPAATRARKQIADLKERYAALARKSATTDPPLTQKQTTVFNNCEMIVCSDAANVGMNLGNASELVMYDSLGSPALEWQRITRCARMLPPAVQAALTRKKGSPAPSALVPKLDADPEKAATMGYKKSKGKWVSAVDGPFRTIKKKERRLFKPKTRGAPTGMVHGLSLMGSPGDDMTYSEGLELIAGAASTAASDSEAAADIARGGLKKKMKAQAAQWRGIANKARMAANLGNNQAEAAFEALKQTRVPGGTKNVISYSGMTGADPKLGTYDRLEIDDPVAAIQGAIDQLDETDKAIIASAGFTSGDEVGSLDPSAIYLAIRAQEVMDYIESRRPVVSAEMREGETGVVVTDADVMNAIIDELSPEDRAILKTKKYLVNVRRLGVSADVPQTKRIKVSKDSDPVDVFVGYEREHPVRTETGVRTTARARQVVNESIMRTVQEGPKITTELDYDRTIAQDVSNISRKDVVKSTMRLGVRRCL